MRLLALGIAFAAAGSLAGPAYADNPASIPITPSLQFTVVGDGINWNSNNVSNTALLWNWTTDAATGAFGLGSDWSWTSGAQVAPGTPAFTLSMNRNQTYGNIDPFLAWGWSAQNNTASAMTFTQTFTSPVAGLTDPFVLVDNQVGYSLTNIPGSGTVDLGAIGAGKVSEFQLCATNCGVASSWVSAGVGAGDSTSFAAAGTTQSQSFVAGPLQIANAPWTQMRVVTTFTLSGAGDVASLSGLAQISPVPEPESYALMVAGLLAAWARMRSRGRTTV